MKNAGSFMRRWGGLIIGVILFFITCFSMYFIQYRMYGGTIKTSLIYVIIFVPIAFISWLLQERPAAPEAAAADNMASDDNREDTLSNTSGDSKENGGIKAALKKIWKILYPLIIVGCSIFMVYAVINNPYYLIVYQYFGLILVLIFLTVLPKMRGKAGIRPKISVAASMLFGALLIVDAIFCLAAPLATVSDAQTVLEEDGYTSVEYAGVLSNRMALDLAFNGDVQFEAKDTGKLGFYLLRGEKDGEEYGAAVSVVGGEVVGSDRTDGNDSLSFYLSYVK